MNREEIKEYLPHREPMLLVDEATIDANGIAHGQYTVRGDEFFLQGHFPNHPVVPGVILCEIMGQCSALLVKEHLKGRTPMFCGIDNVRFKTPVQPNDTLHVTAHLTQQRGLLFYIEACGTVAGKTAVQGRLSFVLVESFWTG